MDGAIDAAVIGSRALDAVRGGALITVAGGAPHPLRGTSVISISVRADSGQLAELVSRVEAGALTLRVADTYPLDQAARAYARLAAGNLRGRLVLIP